MSLGQAALIALLVALAILLWPWVSGVFFFLHPTPMEASLAPLGNPMAEDGQRGRSLNVWDLQVFDGKLYIGGGSTVDNTGPVTVWAYDPATQRFEPEYMVPEEAIEHFRVFGDRLYIPAADPVEGDANKFYVRTSGEAWQRIESAAIELAHVRDLIKLETGDILLVGNSREFKDLSQPAAIITRDGGQSFQPAGIVNPPRSEFNWFFSVFAYRGTIYAPTSWLKDDRDLEGTIAVFNPDRQRLELDSTLKNSTFIPPAQFEEGSNQQGFYVTYRLWNPVEYRGSLVYPARSYSYYNRNYKQGYMNSLGCYVKPSPETPPLAVTFPELRAVGEDVGVIGDELYALANHRIARNQFVVYVYKTTDPTDPAAWQEVLRFKSRNKARSFEYLDHRFYFGLGQDYGDPIGRSGDILALEDQQ